MSKKTLILCLCVVAALVVGLSTTLAYLTDTDTRVNTFTVGNVDITVEEDFEDGAPLYPGIETNKDALITNTGANDAWVWMTVAVPADVDEYVDLVWASGVQPLSDEGEIKTGEDGNEYVVYTVLVPEVLASGDSTGKILDAVELDESVDYQDGQYVSVVGGVVTPIEDDLSELDVIVTGYAMQTEGFDTVEEAYEAYGVQWGDKTPTEATGSVVPVEGNDKAALVAAIDEAQSGDTVRLTEDLTIAGYAATNKLVIEKDIVLDLNGKILTTECGWGGIDAKGGCSIQNGTIKHTGNTAAIKAFQLKRIENVDIEVTQTEGKVKGGIVVQEGAGCYVGSIKNVTITGATNGIETYRCGSRDDYAIGSLINVTIDATDTGILLSAPVGSATNCQIEGDNIGVNMYLYGPYSVSLNLVDSTVSGATGIYAHDEVGVTNPGSLELKADAATTITGGVVEEFEAEAEPRVTITIP